MAFDLSLAATLGLAAGALIVLIGAFVLAARPTSWLHRLFFLLALADGASTALFHLGYIATAPIDVLYYHGLYWYHYLTFIALLGIFGALFPARTAHPALTLALAAGAACILIATLAVYVLDHDLFWETGARQEGGFFQQGPLGNAANAAFVLVVTLIVARLSFVLARETSPSHRRQAAFVLGGMALAYAPGPATFTVLALVEDPARAFLAARPDRVVAYWSYLVCCLVVLASAVHLARDRRPEIAMLRRFVLACYGGVLLTALVTLALPTPLVGRLLRTAGLLAYPLLLGYAIARYEVFDIDAKLRRAATVSLSAVGLTMAFVLAESALENVIAGSVFRGIPSGAVSAGAAALLTAAAFVPIARASRKAAAKLVPELSQDELHARKREIYLHSLAGALADGILREGESRTLLMLRQSLGITDAEHRELLARVQPS